MTVEDREENRQIWRDTQRQINELSVRIIEVDERLGRRIEELAEESRAEDKRVAERIDQLGEQPRAEDKRLGERIDSLVSAIGTLVASMPKPR
jgi:hypothetical protein